MVFWIFNIYNMIGTFAAEIINKMSLGQIMILNHSLTLPFIAASVKILWTLQVFVARGAKNNVKPMQRNQTLACVISHTIAIFWRQMYVLYYAEWFMYLRFITAFVGLSDRKVLAPFNNTETIKNIDPTNITRFRFGLVIFSNLNN